MAGPGRRELLLAFKEKYLKGIRSNAGLRGASGFLFDFLHWDTSFWIALPLLERLADIYLHCSIFTMMSRLYSRLLSRFETRGLDVSFHDLGYGYVGRE